MRGVDVRLWWSNGMSVRAVRGTGEHMAESFTTAKGQIDKSLTGNISSVHFPGVYSFEGSCISFLIAYQCSNFKFSFFLNSFKLFII